MKVLAINGSPNNDKGTYLAIKTVADELIANGIEVEIINIGKNPVAGCIACGACSKKADRKCAFDDDIVNECIEKSKTADGLIIASPVYYAGIAGSMKCFLDRFFYAGNHLANKVGTAVVSVRREGGASAYHEMLSYLELGKMIIAPTQYWNVLHGRTEDEVKVDAEGIDVMKSVGQNMAWLLKCLEEGKKKVEPPVITARARTNFVR